MEIILDILYIYIAIYTVFFLALALRNLSDKPFRIERRYAQYEEKQRLAVVIYAHNNKNSLAQLVNQLNSQDYPIDDFKVFVLLDNCCDGSEDIFINEPFIKVINIKNVGTIGKDQAVSMLLEKLANDNSIDAYVFIDGDRSIPSDFLSTVNSSLSKNSAVSGETLMMTKNLGPVDKIKAAYQKYHMNFLRQSRSLFGLAARADSGMFIIKKEVVDKIGEVDFKDINSELRYSLLLSKIGYTCTYNPNIQTCVDTLNYEFKQPRMSVRLNLFKDCLKQLKFKNFVFIEHTFSLLYPNFWMIALVYLWALKHSYHYTFLVEFKIVLFTLILMLAGFAISLINSKLTILETIKLCIYPIYSICHIIKHFPPVRAIRNKIAKREELPAGLEKLSVDVMVLAGKDHTHLPCRLEFISESGLAKVKFIYKNKKYVTEKHLRMLDALQELKLKLNEYNFIIKICSCCENFKSCPDGSRNMLKGICNNVFPSPELNNKKETLIWNSCTEFKPGKIENFIQEIAEGSLK